MMYALFPHYYACDNAGPGPDGALREPVSAVRQRPEGEPQPGRAGALAAVCRGQSDITGGRLTCIA